MVNQHIQRKNRSIHINEVKCRHMSDRTDRLLAILVILLAVLVVAQTTVVPRNRTLSTIGLLTGVIAIVYALTELVKAN